ncbi:hypothetical protein HRI_000661000 [Hibiscus trionum]|uniref:Uncharacterized protein n=1 Tax=Hibiscus trionum TaxID=183268 RepID=A0A9W7LMD4_HIBTR|nr:hypothetical protein HRI_000661000 [Hibiscus trionum]
MSETNEAHIDELAIVSSTHGEDIRRGNPQNPPQPQDAPVQGTEPLATTAQAECYQNMDNMLKQFMAAMLATPFAQPIPLVVQYVRAPVEKLASIRAYSFTGHDDDNPKIIEY